GRPDEGAVWDRRTERLTMAIESKAFDPDYWLCQRCNSWKPVDDFFGTPPSQPDAALREYKLCAECRKGLKGPAHADRADHERRQMTRIANLARPKGPLR